MPSVTHGAGYLLNDNRASGGTKREYDVLTCPHCQAVINVQNWKAGDGNNGWCMKCSKPICGHCADLMLTEGCVPFMKRIERVLEAQYRSQQLRRIAGLTSGTVPGDSFRGQGIK